MDKKHLAVVLCAALLTAMQHSGVQAQDGPKRGNVFRGVIHQNTTSGNHVTLKRYDHVGKPHFFRDAVGDPKSKHRMAGRPWERKHKGRARVGDLPYDYRLIPKGSASESRHNPGASRPPAHRTAPRSYGNPVINIYELGGNGGAPKTRISSD